MPDARRVTEGVKCRATERGLAPPKIPATSKARDCRARETRDRPDSQQGARDTARAPKKPEEDVR